MDKEIKFIDQTDSINHNTCIISKELVEKIYIAENAEYIQFSKKEIKIQKTVKSNNEWFQQGVRDASLYYHGFGTAACVTGATTAYYPLFGLVTAVATSSTEPRIQNLGIPDKDLAKNVFYVAGYTQQAKKIKKRRIWTSFGIGTGVYLGLMIISSSQTK